VTVRVKMRFTSTSGGNSRDDGDTNSPYLGLIYSVFQLPRDAANGIAIAVTAPNRGAGTSFTVNSLAAELGSYPSNRILRVDLSTLANTIRSGEDVLQLTMSSSHPGIFHLRSRIDAIDAGSSAYWHASAEHRRECIDRLRGAFHYVLFDCPAVLASSDVLGVASLVDGVILLVEANRTTSKQISQAERQIEAAGGRLCGSILNKRKSPLPDWAQRRL
jgi:protein-tyrosine kinase